LSVESIKHIRGISLLDEIHTVGNSPLKVLADDFKIYAVKNSKNKHPARDIINELLAHYFLKLWGIQTPSISLITMNHDYLLPNLSVNHQPNFYNKDVFASKWIDNAIEITSIYQISNKFDYKKFHYPEVLFKIGLFDLWVENEDRRPNNHNLILQNIEGKFHILPIDHAFIFGPMNYINLNPSEFCASGSESIFFTNLALSLKKYLKKNKIWHPIDKDYFYLCLEKCKEEYSNIVANIPITWGFTDDHSSKLYDFLFNEERNDAVFQEYLYNIR